MSTPGRDEVLAAVLPPALELTAAFALSSDDPLAGATLYWETVRRIVEEALRDADPSRAIAELLFGLSALAAILLDELAASTGRDRGEVLTTLQRTYLAG